MTAAEAAKRIGALHDEWVKTAKYESIPVAGPNTQYPETEEDVHTDPKSDAEFMTQMNAILDELRASRGETPKRR